MKEIFIRRSIRKYKNIDVSDDIVRKIIAAGMQAPSAGNQRPWEFIVVKGSVILEQLSQASKYSGCVKNAPVAIVLLANKSRMRFPENFEQDMGACAQNILLECVHLGLGSVWLGIAPIKDRMNKVIEIFELAQDIIPFAIISIGYPEDENANRFVDRFEEERVQYK